jgi:general secretion pathway protein B
MSFILDALRKSEHERQRQAGPGIAELPVARATSRYPVVLLAVGALLAINLVVLLYWLLKNDAPPVVQEEPVAAQPAPAPMPTEEIQRPVAVVVPRAPEAPAPQPVQEREVRPLAAEVEAGPPPDSSPPPAPDPSLLPAVPPPAPRVTYQQQPAPDASYVPRIDTLPPQATAGMPALNLDLHIYSTDPAQRAVFINGNRYRAGDSLPQGIDVVAITPDGAVLRYQGRQFLLPHQ